MKLIGAFCGIGIGTWAGWVDYPTALAMAMGCAAMWFCMKVAPE